MSNDTMAVNICIPIQVEYPDILDNSALQIIFYLIYGFITITGLVGNLLVVIGLTYHNVNLSVRSVFVLSLAVSDILLSLTTIPLTAITTFNRVWLFGQPMCRIIGFVLGGGVFITSFTLSAIAVDRYRLIVHPMVKQLSQPCGTVIVVTIWICGWILSSPVMIYSSIKIYTVSNNTPICGVFCDEDWSPVGAKKAYGIAVLVLQYVIPLTITAFCYSKVVQTVKFQVQKRLSNENMLPVAESRLQQRQKRTSNMTVAMVSSFMLAWLPLNLLNIARDFNLLGKVFPDRLYSLLFMCGHCIAMCSVIVNPIIYAWFNTQFRSVVRKTYFCSSNAYSYTTNNNPVDL